MIMSRVSLVETRPVSLIDPAKKPCELHSPPGFDRDGWGRPWFGSSKGGQPAGGYLLLLTFVCHAHGTLAHARTLHPRPICEGRWSAYWRDPRRQGHLHRRRPAPLSAFLFLRPAG